VRRARELRLVVWDGAHELIRTAKRYGLLVTVSRSGDATVLAIVGPLLLFHDTGVYGGALASVVPLLADLARFELTVVCDFGYGPSTLRVTPPVLLPPVVPRGKPSLAVRLARDLAKLAPEVRIERDPPPIASTTTGLVFPDLALEHRGTRTAIEILWFATAEYIAAQLARYAAAGTRALLCVRDQAPGSAADHPQILRFPGRLSAAAVLAKLAELP
jgi:predicted nuclease of restriction endonuclease-like RecB superfamily